MSIPREAQPAKLICSMLIRPDATCGAVMKKLIGKFGQVDLLSEPFPFDKTEYYEKEMGKVVRRVASFENLVAPERLPEIKLATNLLENDFRVDDKRTVNLDPGLVTVGHLVLATGKGAGHRPYLGRGVYADMTLIYEQGEFRTLPWTYPDYSDPQMLNLMVKIRDKYLRDRRSK